MTTAAVEPIVESESRSFVLEGISWELYTRLREETDDNGQRVRMIYDEGRLVLMSPMLPKHERIKKVVARLIEQLTLELDIPMEGLGSTTWRREDLAKGLEADECFYIQHQAEIVRKERIELPENPPPDLAVEVDITHHPKSRQAIYASLGVGELWQYDGARINFYILSDRGKYESVSTSRALPITSDDVNRFLAMLGSVDQTALLKSFRQWVRSRGA
jgi:Uma2 family endonuclease